MSCCLIFRISLVTLKALNQMVIISQMSLKILFEIKFLVTDRAEKLWWLMCSQVIIQCPIWPQLLVTDLAYPYSIFILFTTWVAIVRWITIARIESIFKVDHSKPFVISLLLNMNMLWEKKKMNRVTIKPT